MPRATNSVATKARKKRKGIPKIRYARSNRVSRGWDCPDESASMVPEKLASPPPTVFVEKATETIFQERE